MAEGVRGTHVSMGLTGARADACMDHLKGVQEPRNRPGSWDACTESLCPGERHYVTRTRATGHVTSFCSTLGFHGFGDHISRFHS